VDWGGAGFGSRRRIGNGGWRRRRQRDFGGITGMTGCFSPGNRLICPFPSFFCSSRTSSFAFAGGFGRIRIAQDLGPDEHQEFSSDAIRCAT